MEAFKEAFAPIKQAFIAFSKYRPPAETLKAVGEVSEMCLQLMALTERRSQGTTPAGKDYDVFQAGGNISRPVNTSLLVMNPAQFLTQWETAMKHTNPARVNSFSLWDETLYTAAVAFACAYDLCQPGSRKTPGTYLESMFASLLELLTGRKTQKYIPLREPSRINPPTREETRRHLRGHNWTESCTSWCYGTHCRRHCPPPSYRPGTSRRRAPPLPG